MGHEIVYCFKCSSRIVGVDSDKSVAFPIRGRIACAACASELLPTLPPAEQEELLARMNRTAAPKHREPTKRTPRRGTEAVPAYRETADSRTPLILAGVVGAFVVLLLIVLASRSAPPPPPAPEVTQRPVERPPRAPVDAPKPKENFDAELARIDDSIAGVIRQEGFKEAIDYLTSARKRHDAPEWTKAVDQRLGKTNDDIQALYVSLQKKAEDARRRGAESEVKDLVDRVARWNQPERAAALKKALDATVAVAAFKQGADGLVCIEAEHCSAQSEAGNHAWKPVREPAGYSGDGAMAGLPNDGLQAFTDFASTSPRMDFRVEFAKSGTHYLWVRAAAGADSDNSVHGGLDGSPVAGLTAITWSPTKNWVWTNKKMDNKVASFTVATAGAHTIHFWVREDGCVVDRFVITSDPKWSPKGNGPAESPR